MIYGPYMEPTPQWERRSYQWLGAKCWENSLVFLLILLVLLLRFAKLEVSKIHVISTCPSWSLASLVWEYPKGPGPARLGSGKSGLRCIAAVNPGWPDTSTYFDILQRSNISSLKTMLHFVCIYLRLRHLCKTAADIYFVAGTKIEILWQSQNIFFHGNARVQLTTPKLTRRFYCHCHDFYESYESSDSKHNVKARHW